MSDGGGFRFSHAVGLLLPIIALPIGWWVGNAPIPDPKPAPPVVAQAQAPSTARTQQRPAGAPSVRMTVAPGAEPAPVAEPAPGPPRDEAPAGLSQWTTIDRALEESRRNGKPVFIDFSADWCGPCQQLKQQVFDDGTRAHALQSAVIPVSIVDRRRETGSNPPEIEALQQQYQVEAFPTLVVFSPATGRTMTARGFRGGDATLAWITEAARAVR